MYEFIHFKLFPHTHSRIIRVKLVEVPKQLSKNNVDINKVYVSALSRTVADCEFMDSLEKMAIIKKTGKTAAL